MGKTRNTLPGASEGAAERLSKALRESGMTLTEFHERAVAVAGEAAPSYPATGRYFRGANQPQLPFLELAAHVLGANPVWLAFGRGDPWNEAEVPAVEGVEQGDADLTEAVRTAFGANPEAAGLERRRSDALRRLIAWLETVQAPHAPWSHRVGRLDILRRAAGVLAASETLHLRPPQSASVHQEITWQLLHEQPSAWADVHYARFADQVLAPVRDQEIDALPAVRSDSPAANTGE